ncbi:hypothetical protein GE061_012863 [Apolygus lucorum]|uniref:Uncharacterized protein n=1 Tax=Apolygus lucorum TaxID=248454 RepID=A0A8S9XVK1_APOLU|nr:hypothetical protein GE061_012863 [Apolygus lucorum]
MGGQKFGGRGPGFGPPGPDRDEEREFRGPGGPPGDFRGPPGGPPPGFNGPGEFEGPDFHEFNEGPPEFHEGRPDFHGRGPEFHGPPEFHRGGPDFPGRGGFFGPRGPRGMVSQGRAPLLRSPNGPPMFGPRGPGPMGMRGPPHGPPGGLMEGPNFMGPPPSHGGPQLRGFQGMRLRGSRFPLLQTPPGGRQWDEFPRMGDEMVRPPRPPREERKSRWGNSDDREDDGPRDMEMGGGDFDGLDGSADTGEVKGSENNEEKPVSALLEENFQTAEVNKSPAEDKPLSAILEDVSKPTGDLVKEEKPLSELLEENFKPDENKPINDDKPLSAMLEEKLDVPEPSKPLSEILEHALPEEKDDKPLSAILEQSSEANKPSGGNFDMFDASSEPEVKIREEPVPQQEFNEPVASFMDDLPPPKDEMQEYVDVPSREEIAPHKEEIASHREDMPPHEDRQETPHTEETPSHREDIHEEPPSKHEGSPVRFDSPKPAEDAPSPNMADPVQSEPTPAE